MPEAVQSLDDLVRLPFTSASSPSPANGSPVSTAPPARPGVEKNAQDTRSGAGQCFTPRALIRAIVDVMQPKPGDTICDPACGTGGFLLAAHAYISDPEHYKLDKDQKKHLKHEALRGWEIVDSTARLCAMNLDLHGIGGDESPITVDDALQADPGKRFSTALTNPPFGGSRASPS